MFDVADIQCDRHQCDKCRHHGLSLIHIWIAMSLDSFSTMEEQVGEYYLKTWNIKRDVWLSVCRKGSASERCLPEKIALEQVFL